MSRLLASILALGFCAANAGGQATLPDGPTAANAPSKFRSAEDGWLDVAFGPDDAAIYVQVGSAWARP